MKEQSLYKLKSISVRMSYCILVIMGAGPGIALQELLLSYIYDQWLEAVDNGNIAGCMMLDLSAAYDLANHDLILRKLELYGFEPSTVKWMKSYLDGRSQCVYIDGELSDNL